MLCQICNVNLLLFDFLIVFRLFNHTATFRRESDYPLSTHFIKDLADWTETPAVPIEEKNRSVVSLYPPHTLVPSPSGSAVTGCTADRKARLRAVDETKPRFLY